MEPVLDLTLKLGLPVSDQTVETSLSLHTSTSINTQQPKGINVGSGHQANYGGVGGDRHRFLTGGRAINGQNEGVENNVSVNVMFSNYILQRFSGADNTSGNLPFPVDPTPATSPTPITLSECVMIDVPARRAHRNSSVPNANANANTNANAVGKRRVCGGGCHGFNERFKRCTNIKCNTNETPMWRKGPLGPKSLCNACGIKYRKEMERRSRNNN